MKVIHVDKVVHTIKEMCMEANYFLSPDMQEALHQAKEKEKNPLGVKIFRQLEENLNIGQVGGAKALRLYQRTKEAIKTAEQAPAWVGEVIEKIKSLPMEAESILLEEDNEFDF